MTEGPVDRLLTERLLPWYRTVARDLPWRRPGTSPWGVLVSEVMLQQTQAGRVAPAYESWMRRWPSAGDLAAATPGDAVRMWGRLGYPRRALRLHAAAGVVVARHDGEVPTTLEDLLALPGVGAYTARAVLAFGFARRAPVVDVNVRRVVARWLRGEADGGPATTARDFARVDAVLPADDATAAVVSAALMELGATLCGARTPSCADCPLRESCRWLAEGTPDAEAGTRRTAARYEGSDRQARGALLRVLRDSTTPVAEPDLATAWPSGEQRRRALASLVRDGLAVRDGDGCLALP